MVLTGPDRQGAYRSTLERGLSIDERERLDAVLTHAALLLSTDQVPRLEDIDDFGAAHSALTSARGAIRQALQGNEEEADDLLSLPSLIDLAAQLGDAEAIVGSAEGRAQHSAVRTAWETLAELQGVRSVQQLISSGAEAVCRLGFDRAVISRVNDSTWTAEAVHVDGDVEWASEILTAGRERPQTLAPGLPELDVVRRPRPIVVTRVQEREQIYQAVAETSQTRAYAAAPIVPSSKVIGFVHADRYYHRGEISSFDCDLLNLFAQGFGYALERAMLVADIERMRVNLRSIASNLTDLCDEGTVDDDFSSRTAATGSSQALGVEGFARPSAPSALDIGEGTLTRREHEVLRLMATGETNRRIAHRLVISEGTVKSHVKHILRKLHAANRAEAVARWHRAQVR